jgi:hypothetical protein
MIAILVYLQCLSLDFVNCVPNTSDEVLNISFGLSVADRTIIKFITTEIKLTPKLTLQLNLSTNDSHCISLVIASRTAIFQHHTTHL